MDVAHTLPGLLAWLLAVPGILAVHEAGHALGALAAGRRVTSVGVGPGRRVLRVTLRGGTVVYLGPALWRGGATVAIPAGDRAGPLVLQVAGGLLAQGALALLLALVVPRLPVLRPVAEFNLLVLLFNLLPWRVRGAGSDGWQLVAGARGAPPAMYRVALRPRLARLAAFEEMIGSAAGAAWCRAMLRWIDLELGRHDPTEVRAAWAEVARRPGGDPWLEGTLAWVAAESERRDGAPLGALHVVRTLRSAHAGRLPDAVSDLLTVAEARAWLDLDEGERALRVLARLAGVGGSAGREAAAVRLDVACAGEEGGEIADAARRLIQLLPGPALDDPGVAWSLWRAGERLEARGETREAGRLQRAARRQGARLLAGADPADRRDLLLRLGPIGGLVAAHRRSTG